MMSSPPDSELLTEPSPRIDSLVAALAHALRNPLAAAIANLEVLEAHGPLTDAARSRAGRIAGDLERIRTIVEDLTEFASPPAVDARPMPLDKWIRENLPLIRVFAETRGVALNLDKSIDGTAAEFAGCIVTADPRVLRKAVIRLVQNALDAGASQVWFHVKMTPQGADLSIVDRAPYDSAPSPIHVKPFESTKPRNLGLGLTLVRKSLAPLGARVRLERTHGGETRATLTLRRQGAAAQEAAS